MFRKFLRDIRGNYALATIAVAVPLLGGLALAVDYSEMSRERGLTLNALDAAGIATARRVVEGASDSELQTYARNFFNANLGNIDPNRVTLSLVLPKNNAAGGGTLKIAATLTYQSVFFDAFERLRGADPQRLSFSASSEVKLKNTIEVALVLDNSGSMDYTGSGSGKKRMVLLKDAAKQLVDTLAAQSAQMKQLQKPVQFGLVPFAGSVNVGTDNASAAWMDTTGVSPIHHENFDWSVYAQASNPTKYVETISGVRYARGADWGTLKDQVLTRFTLYDKMRRVSGTTTQTVTTTERYCSKYLLVLCLEWSTRPVQSQVTVDAYGKAISWEGCIETRPYPHNVSDTAASKSTPATMFVPMFAPDEAGNIWTPQSATETTPKKFKSYNSWWDDLSTTNPTAAAGYRTRQRDMKKYFATAPITAAMPAAHDGPNSGCTTTAILPLTDVSTTAGVTKVKTAIDGMISLGATNVPEGMAWGWRVLSSAAPFTGGRPESEKGNDKVVIVLTDGENTYYTPNPLGNSLGETSVDNADCKSIYSNYGYVGSSCLTDTSTTPRLFSNTSSSVPKTTYTNANYTKAMNEHFATLCNNAKAAGITVMTVALDLDAKNTAEKAQIDALTACASPSRFRKDSSGSAAKLFWNATGGSLANDFKSIADELSNLRIVS